MDSTRDSTDHSKPEPSQAPPASPLPTPTENVTTDAPVASPPTHSFHPTAPTLEDEANAVQPPLQPNTVIDGYVVLENVGRGGMGIVFKAKQPQTGQIVALKMIRDGVFADKESLERFRQEIATLGRVQPLKNVVPIYHVGQFQSQSYYVMPYFPRGNLANRLKHFKGHVREAVIAIEKVARAVHQLHAVKILHRDIKPGNILLDAQDEPYLSDFGLIKQLDQDESLTRTHQRLGTPAYMAPEQTGLTPAAVGRGTDIWALGVVLYEALTGTRPFNAAKDDTTKLFWDIAYSEPPAPRTLSPQVDAGLDAVILKCLEKLPQDRFSSADEFADELHRWLHQEPLRTRPIGTVGRWWRGHRYLRRAAIALLFLIPLAIVAVFAYRHYTDPDRPLREIQSEYASTGRAELMRDHAPRWRQWSMPDAGQIATTPDGFTISSENKLALLILARDLPPRPQFRLSAKIRHDQAASLLSEVGLFVAHHPANPEPNAPRIFYRCVFNDRFNHKDATKVLKLAKPVIKGNPVQLGYVFHGELNERDRFYHSPNWILPIYFDPPPLLQRVWRDVAIEVSPGQINAEFDGKRSAPLPIATATKRLEAEIARNKKLIPEDAPISAEFDAAGAMGLLILNGNATFKDVVVEILK